jgi:hypothetical protein
MYTLVIDLIILVSRPSRPLTRFSLLHTNLLDHGAQADLHRDQGRGGDHAGPRQL